MPQQLEHPLFSVPLVFQKRESQENQEKDFICNQTGKCQDVSGNETVGEVEQAGPDGERQRDPQREGVHQEGMRGICREENEGK